MKSYHYELYPPLTMKSWKTTLGGIIAAIGAAMLASDDHQLKLIGGVVAAVGALITGFTARDNDRTSEEVGADRAADHRN